jgi:hypothetical protein
LPPAEPRKERTHSGLALRLPHLRLPPNAWPIQEPFDPDPAQVDARVRKDLDDGVLSSGILLLIGLGALVLFWVPGYLAPSGVWIGVLLGWLGSLGPVPDIPYLNDHNRARSREAYRVRFRQRVGDLRDRRALARLLVPAGLLLGGAALLVRGPHRYASEWVLIFLDAMLAFTAVVSLGSLLLCLQVRRHIG